MRDPRNRPLEHLDDGIFTAFVRSAAAGRRLEDAQVQDVLAELERILHRELRRRRVWKLPPSRLGVIGYTTWDQPGALAELAVDAFEDAILRRLRGLYRQLSEKPDIEGIVRTNVKRFLRDLQRRGDPLGYRAWELVLSAAERAVKRGTISVLDGGPIDMTTRLVIGRPEDVSEEDELVQLRENDERSRRLRLRVARWNNELLPDLVTARGRRRDDVVARFADRLPGLADDGIRVFRLRDLLAALRDDLRPQWAARFWEAGMPAEAQEIGATGESGLKAPVLRSSIPSPNPEQILSDREAVRRLDRCVKEALADADDARSMTEAHQIWCMLTIAAIEEEGMPSQRELARVLGIPRNRIPKLLALIDEAVARCRRSLGF